MWTPEKVKNTAIGLGFKPFYTRTELKHLYKILHENEQILAIIEGELKKIHNKTQSGWGIVLLTDRRVIFFRKSVIGTITNEEISLKQISSTSFRKGVMQSSLHVYTANNESEVTGIDKKGYQSFSLLLQKILHEPTHEIHPEVTNSPVEIDNLTKLEKLFVLKEKGAITEAEYITQKNQLLN